MHVETTGVIPELPLEFSVQRCDRTGNCKVVEFLKQNRGTEFDLNLGGVQGKDLVTILKKLFAVLAIS